MVSSTGRCTGVCTTSVPTPRLRTSNKLISGAGNDPFGRFVRNELARLGVDSRYVHTHGEYPTPVTPAAATEQVQRALQHVTVAVGNREECEIAVGETIPHKASDALLDLGVELAIVKQGPRATIGKTKHSSVTVLPNEVGVVNGLGAGDAFGSSLIHGLLRGWPLEKTLRYADAAGATVASRLECSTAMPTAAEVADLADQTGSGGSQPLAPTFPCRGIFSRHVVNGVAMRR
ncbi:MAG: PfkB family carbohydrate kinase [Mycobacterium sp.]